MTLPSIGDITLNPLFTAAVLLGTSATSIGELCEAAFGGTGPDWTNCCHRSVSGVDRHYTRPILQLRYQLGWHPKITFSELVAMMVQERSGL
jgi:nucleoside-diphosphate-sugar epimerase